MRLHEMAVFPQPISTTLGPELILMPISDVQYGAVGCDFDKFKRHIEWGMAQGAYFVGLGDMVDVASPTGRAKIQAARLHDSEVSALEEIAQQHLDQFYTAVSGTEGQWIGMVSGHHYYEFEDGTTTDTRLADRLKCPFLDECAIVQLQFSTGQTCQIWLHHGTGSGNSMSAPLNKLERQMMAWPSVDIFLIGHYSRKVVHFRDALVPIFNSGPPHLVAKRRILACTGGFVRGYNEGKSNYVERAMMTPLNLGGIVIYIRSIHTKNGDQLDLGCSL